jgi:hypothetical protein
MKRRHHLILSLTLVGAVAVICCRHPPEPAEPDWPPPAESPATLITETAVVRLRAKKQIALDVAAGRRTLVEAAALFRALNRLPPETTEPTGPDNPTHPWVLTDPVHTEEEQMCREVVEWVYSSLGGESEELAKSAVARLTADFRNELRRHGAIRFPDPSAVTLPPEILDQAERAFAKARR